MTRSIGRLALAVLAIVAGATPASALAVRTFVSGKGLDTNSCSLAAPCRTFAQALSVTAANGEITVLDAAGYGAVTTDKGISIINDGVGEAGVSVNAGDAIIINAPLTDGVVLRGLTINGNGTGANGVTYLQGKFLTVEHCLIRNFTVDGLRVQTAADTTLDVAESVLSNNLTDGILIKPTGNHTTIFSITHSSLLQNPTRNLFLYTADATSGATIKGSVIDSTIAGSANGVTVSVAVAGTKASVSVESSLVTGGGVGVFAFGAGASAYLSRTTVAANDNAYVLQSGGSLFSYGNNSLTDNKLASAGISAAPQQ